jgi:hypothetical protein
MIPRRLALIAACLSLSACGQDAAKGVGAPSAESHAPGTTLATAPGACAAYPKGAPGVINAFCGGPAKVNVTVDGKAYALAGGTCAGQAGPGTFTLNLGVMGTRELAGPLPDYFGITALPASGAFTGAALLVHVGGRAYAVTSNSGTVSPTGGTFSGVTRGGHKVQGAFSC